MNNYDRIGEIRKLVISIDILKNVLFPYFLNVVELANYGIRLYHEWKMNHLFNCFDVAAAILPHTKTPAHDLIKRSEKQYVVDKALCPNERLRLRLRLR